MSEDGEHPVCVRCYEDFPVAQEPAKWRMGELRRLAKATRWVQNQAKGGLLASGRRHLYLCGNCWFSLTE